MHMFGFKIKGDEGNGIAVAIEVTLKAERQQKNEPAIQRRGDFALRPVDWLNKCNLWLTKINDLHVDEKCPVWNGDQSQLADPLGRSVSRPIPIQGISDTCRDVIHQVWSSNVGLHFPLCALLVRQHPPAHKVWHRNLPVKEHRTAVTHWPNTPKNKNWCFAPNSIFFFASMQDQKSCRFDFLCLWVPLTSPFWL